MIKVWKTWSEIYKGNNIDYDVESYQVKTTIVECTKKRIKVLKFNFPQKICWYVQRVCDSIKQTEIRSDHGSNKLSKGIRSWTQAKLLLLITFIIKHR